RGRGDVGRRQLRRVAARRGRGARPRPRPAPRRDAARRPDADERPRALPHAHPRRRDRGRGGAPRALVRAAAGGGGVNSSRARVLRRLPLRVLLALATAAMADCPRVPAEGTGWRTGFVVAALAASGLLALAWRRGGFSTRQVLGLGLLLRLLVFPLAPVLSDDGFRYVWDGLVQVEAGANPYRYVPADPALARLHDEPIYPALNSAQYFSVYPPLSQLVFAAGALAHPLGWLVSWYLIKLLMAAAEVGGLWLLSRMVPARALLLYAWHP